MTVTTFTFDNPAAVVTWTVPNHTGTLTIEARGGDGGRVPGARGGAWAGGSGLNIDTPGEFQLWIKVEGPGDTPVKKAGTVAVS